MDVAEHPFERTDLEATERDPDADVFLRALLELAESAERNRRRSQSETTEDGPLSEAA